MPGRRSRFSAAFAAMGVLGLVACGQGADSLEKRAPNSKRVSVDHIPNDPPGGKWIAPATQAADFVRRFEKTGETIMVGVGVKRLVALAYGVHPHDVIVAQADAEVPYDAIVKPPRGAADTSYAMLRALLRERLGLTAAPRRDQTLCMVLQPLPSGVMIEPSASTAGVLDLQEGRLTARGATMAQLIDLLRRDARRPIVDETGLPEHYDFVLEWDPGKGAYAFLQALGDIGLKLEAGVREVDRWVAVRGAAGPTDRDHATERSQGDGEG